MKTCIVETCLGERLRARRIQLGIPQYVLAARCGMRQPQVSDLERGEVTTPRLQALCAMADVLEVSLDWLLGRAGAPEPVPPVPPAYSY